MDGETSCSSWDSDDEYQKFIQKMNPPRVVIDNTSCRQCQQVWDTVRGSAGPHRAATHSEKSLHIIRWWMVHGWYDAILEIFFLEID
ncbi:Os03g0413100 [Oryza sativa Japonica Group]|uniref:Os03g0413100 protein n=1 Tax=Oryza sativa subsp. japonica TaxID=39947 RepID=A0A0P0VZJ6_ORYSJ|nr:hypothetical protein EE612_018092 [Oryza sativa]BAS84679.1 Os03g0413100 [Oryza sativa Japonica Group]